VILSSPQVPLMQFGEINLGKFRYQAEVKQPHIYSWVMNNYWTTNFKASQEGEFKWQYHLTSGATTPTKTGTGTLSSDATKTGTGALSSHATKTGTGTLFSGSMASRFGWNSRVPFISRVLPAVRGAAPMAGGSAEKGKADAENSKLPAHETASLLQGVSPHLLLVAARPSRDGKGVLFQWRELDGVATTLDLPALLGPAGFTSFMEVNVLEDPLEKIDGAVIFNPHEVKFIQGILPF
jgi:alpha-mannosidase